MDFNVGDLVILVDDESPEDREKRTKKKSKKKTKKKDKIVRKFAVIDVVDKVQGGRPITKKKKFKAHSRKSNDEYSSDKNKRKKAGKPVRKMYFGDLDWFPMPRGLQGTADSVELDEEFINNTLIPYDQQIRES